VDSRGSEFRFHATMLSWPMAKARTFDEERIQTDAVSRGDSSWKNPTPRT